VIMKTLAAILMFALPAAAAAAEAGSSALSFLKVDAGARAAALGGAYCAAGDDALAVFYNPAGTVLARRTEALLGHNEWLGGLRNETAAYVHPFGQSLTVFGGLNALFSGDMTRYDASGTSRGSFNSREGAASAGVSARLGRGWYGGLAAKGLYQAAAGESAMAWAGDAGLLAVYGRLRFGLSASNFGGAMKLRSRAFALPLMLRGGVSAEAGEYLRFSADAVKPGESDLQGAFGAEAELPANPQEAFYLRAGYRTGRSGNAGPGLSAGVGFGNGELRLDYAFAPYGDLGDSHRVTLAFAFGAQRLPPGERKAYKITSQERSASKKAAAAAELDKKTSVSRGKKPAVSDGDSIFIIW